MADRSDGKQIMPQDEPMWCIDYAYSIGNTIDDNAHGNLPILDTELHPSIAKAITALNSGVVSCPNGMCIVRSERQKLYFLVVRSDKLHDCANVATNVLNLRKAEQPFSQSLHTGAPLLLGSSD